MVHQVVAAAIASRPEHGVLSLDTSAAFTSLRKTEVVCSVEWTIPELTPWIAGLMNHRATAPLASWMTENWTFWFLTALTKVVP